VLHFGPAPVSQMFVTGMSQRLEGVQDAAARRALEARPARLAFTPKRLLHEQKHFVERTVQCLHIVFAFRGLDQGAKVTEGGHLVHAVLRCVWRDNLAAKSGICPDWTALLGFHDGQGDEIPNILCLDRGSQPAGVKTGLDGGRSLEDLKA
jgi:hypothetical protein